MSRRAELYRVVRDLKNHLRWQKASGAVGSVPAPADERAAFEAKKKAREKAQLERVKRSFAAPTTTTTRKAAPEAAAAGREATRSEATRSEAARPVATQPEPTTPAAPPFGSTKQKEAAPPETSAPSTPWKSFGSRPTKRFAAGQAPEPTPESKPESKPEPKPEVAVNDGPPDYDEAFYPEADDMMPPADYNPGQLSKTRPTPQAAKPEKDASEMSKKEKLDFLRDYMGDCRRCGLCEHRTNIAFGVGDPEAKLVFVGEAPGYNEDRQGEPFVGKAGNLLDKMIEAMGLKRNNVYICNVIKCRPPNNRDPHPDEIRECSPFLRKQLEAIDPDVIVTLGRFAGQFLTGEDKSMGALRGRWHDWEGIPVMPTYHPAYLLRSPQQKGKAWSDLQMVMEKMGL